MTQQVMSTQQTVRPLPFRSVIVRMLRNDARLIGRDSFLMGLFGYIVGISLFLRLALPELARLAAESQDIDINVPDFYPLLVGYMVVFLANVIGGMMIGFIVLDERDTQTIKALMITPISLNRYIAYRVVVPAVLSAVVIVVEMYIVNQALLPLGQMVMIAAAASLTSPLIMLFFATFAQNKVQGFALNKIVSVLGLSILAAWFIDLPVQLVFGLFPPYWFVKGYWVAVAGGADWLLYLAVGVVYTGGVILYLARRFHAVAQR